MGWVSPDRVRRSLASRASLSFLSFLTAFTTVLALVGVPLPAAAASHVTVFDPNVHDFKTLIESAASGDVIQINGSGNVLNPTVIQLTDLVFVPPGVTIEGLGAKAEEVEIRANGSAPAFTITAGPGTVTIENLEITNADDRKASGGGIGVQAGATLELRAVSLNDNFAGEGGGLHNAGTTYVYDSVFYANEAAGKGGGVNNAGYLEIWNSTFASNDAQQGGAISSSGTVNLHFVTIVGNSSKNKIGAGTHLNGGTVNIYDSIVANNFSGGSFYDCSGQTTVDRVLFSSVQGCQPSGTEGTGPNDTYQVVSTLEFELADGTNPKYADREYPFDNGGPTKTVALIDQDMTVAGFQHPALGYGEDCTVIDPLLGEIPREDQRGVVRPDPCSVGAYEVDPADIDVTLATSTSSIQVGAVSASIDSITASLQAIAAGGGSVSSTPFGSIPFGSIDVRDNPFGSIAFDQDGVATLPFGSIPFGSIPFGSIPYDSTGVVDFPFGSIPFGSIPFGSIPFGSIDYPVSSTSSTPFGSIPFGSIPFGSILLSELSTADGSSMDFYLTGTPDEGAPLQTLSFGEFLSTPFGSIDLGVSPFGSISIGAVPFGSIGIDPSEFIDCTAFLAEYGISCDQITPYNSNLPTLEQMALDDVPFTGTVGDVLGLDDVNVSSTSLAYLPFGSILLGPATIGDLPFGSIGDNFSQGLDGWCDALGQDVCFEFGITDSQGTVIGDNGQSLLSLALGGVDIGSVPFGSITADLPFGSIPFGSIPFGSIHWDVTPFGSIAGLPLAICDDLLAEGVVASSSECDTMTILQAYADGAQLSSATLADLEGWAGLADYSLADLLIGFFPPAEIPWLEAEDLNAIRLPDADDQPYFTYGIGLDVFNRGADVAVELTLPEGFVPAYEYQGAPVEPELYLDGQFVQQVTRPTESQLGTGNPPITLTFDMLELESGNYELRVPVRAGVVLGSSSDWTATATGTILLGGLPVGPTDSASTGIGVTQAASGGFASLIQGNGCSADSNLEIAHIVDASDVEVYEFTVPLDCAGADLEAVLTNLQADLDLVLFGPPANGYLRGTPAATSPYVEDHDYDLNPDDGALDADVLADINVDPASLGIPGSVVPIAVSANRDRSDEGFEVRTPVLGGTYYLAVIGYNGASSDFPFGLQARLRSSGSSGCPTAGACSLALTAGTPTALPGSLAGANTIFLYNGGWLGGNEGSFLAKVDSISAIAGVNAIAIPVDADSTTAGLLNDWYDNVDDARFDPEAANDIVRAIGDLLDSYIDSNHDDVLDVGVDIDYIVVVGPDEAIPFARLVDSTFYSNETDHAPAIPVDGELKSALASGYILSDDPYGSLSGIAIADTEYFVPTIAVGRLVETWDSIAAQLDEFVARNGVLDPDGGDTYAAAAGYDFLTDGVAEIIANLQTGGYSGFPARSLNNETWSNTDLATLLGTAPLATVASINAHFDQYRLLPAINNQTGNEATNLFTVDDLPVLGDALISSMGCHSGLNVSNAQLGLTPSGPSEWFEDWAEALTGGGNLWIGNTGFGYGDSLFVAYSEALSASFADFIGSNTVGRAWSLAKQDYASDLFVVSPYHTKALNEWVLYGLPMYRTHAGVPIGFSSVQFAALATESGPTLMPDPINPGLSLRYAPFSLSEEDIALQDEGGYYSANGGTLKVRGRAAVALAEADVTPPAGSGYEVGGVIVTGLSSVETQSQATIVNPVIDTPDGYGTAPGQSLRYPAPKATFPAGIARVIEGVDSNGDPIDLAQFAASRFDPGSDTNPQNGYFGTWETFGPFDYDVYYRPVGETDKTPPRIKLVSGVSDGLIAYFQVNVSDSVNDVHRVNVLFGPPTRTSPVQWQTVDLVNASGDLWVGGVPVDAPEPGASFAFWVQACDTVGNCDASTAKGVNFLTTDSGDQSFVRIDVDGTEGNNNWYTSVNSLTFTTLTDTASNGIDRYVFDGAEYTGPWASPKTVTVAENPSIAENGGHFVLAYDENGNPPGTKLLAVDSAPPTVEATVEPPGDSFGASGAMVTLTGTDTVSGLFQIRYTLDGTDPADSTSAVYTDSFSVTTTTTVRYAAEDFAGNITEGPELILVVDADPPVVSATANVAEQTWTNQDVTVTITAIDSQSETVSIDWELSGASVDSGSSTTSPANAPVTAEGKTLVTYNATDGVGNTSPDGTYEVWIDKTDPTASVSIANLSLSPIETGSAAITCTDALSLVETCSVTITDSANVTVATDNGSSSRDVDLYTGDIGTYVVTVFVQDYAGNIATDSASYSVADGTPPVATIITPSDADVFIVEPGGTTTATFSCTDGDSPIESCVLTGSGSGILDVGVDTASLDLSTPGTYTLTLTATSAGGTATDSVTYVVAWDICLLYDRDNPQPANGAVAIKVQLCDADGVNQSSRQTTLTAEKLRYPDGTVVDAQPNYSGKSNDPDWGFRYDNKLAGYIFNLNEDPDSLAANIIPPGDTDFDYFYLLFSVAGHDGYLYAAPFTLK